ncbi:MAG: AsmA-like C-terminal domain-containing protein [Candidatus Hydrogenedentes bacterium]|nr:AsmA-like C-terminal domain-containing protein [Candidatus Hydrogenedentota bacterium]
MMTAAGVWHIRIALPGWRSVPGRIAYGFMTLWIAWLLIEHVAIRPDRFRPAVVEALEEATQLPVSVGKLDLALFPMPHLNIYDVTIGTGDFQARSSRITTYANLPALLNRRLILTSVTVYGLAATVSSDTAQTRERIELLISNLRSFESGEEFPLRFEALDRVFLSRARVFTADQTEPIAMFSARIHDVFSDAITVVLNSSLLGLGRDARLTSELTVLRGAQGIEIDGSGSLESIRIIGSSDNAELPETELSARFEVSGNPDSAVVLTVTGDLHSIEGESLEGPFSSALRWEEGILTLDALVCDVPGLRLAADGSIDADGAITLAIPDAEISGDVLKTLLAMADFENIHFESAPGSGFRAEEILISITPDGFPRFASGTITFQGVEVTLPNGDIVEDGIRGRIEAIDGVIYVHELSGSGFSLQGTVHPRPEESSIHVDLSGNATLSSALLAVVLPSGKFRELEGTVSINRISGTFIPGSGVPADLVIEAMLENGRLGLELGEAQGVFDPVVAEIHSDGEGITTTAHASSEEFGDVGFTGRYAFDSHQWLGTATLDVSAILPPFLDDATRHILGAALKEFGESRLQTKIRFPSGDTDELGIYVTREGLPTFRMDAVFFAQESGYTMGPLFAEASLPVNRIMETLFHDLDASGIGQVAFLRRDDEQRYELTIDLTECSLRPTDLVEKKIGDLLTVAITGDAAADAWTTDRITIDCLGVEVPLELDGNGNMTIQELTVDVSRLDALFPKGDGASGRVRLAMTSYPFTLDATFEEVGVTLSPEMAVHSIDGEIHIAEGRFTVPDLRISGVNLDARLETRSDSGVWRGGLTGEALDLNALNVFWDAGASLAWRGRRGLNKRVNQQPDSDEPFIGEFKLDLGHVFYGRGRVDEVHALVVGDTEGLHFNDLTVRVYTGTVEGTIDLSPVTDEERTISVALALRNPELRILDEMAFDEPRGFFGIIDGELEFEAPWDSPVPIIEGATGSFAWTAQDGSFGQLGFATQLLSVLRTTELIALRLPSLRDDGLTYGTCSGTLTIEDGLMRLEEVTLDSSSYAMAAAGIVDWPADTMDVEVRVGVLETLGRILDKVPLLRKAAAITTDLIGVTVHGKGSPFEPDFRVVPGAGRKPKIDDAGDTDTDAPADTDDPVEAEETPPAD